MVTPNPRDKYGDILVPDDEEDPRSKYGSIFDNIPEVAEVAEEKPPAEPVVIPGRPDVEPIGSGRIPITTEEFEATPFGQATPNPVGERLIATPIRVTGQVLKTVGTEALKALDTFSEIALSALPSEVTTAISTPISGLGRGIANIARGDISVRPGLLDFPEIFRGNIGANQEANQRTRDILGTLIRAGMTPREAENALVESFQTRPAGTQVVGSLIDPLVAAGVIKGGLAAGRVGLRAAAPGARTILGRAGTEAVTAQEPIRRGVATLADLETAFPQVGQQGRVAAPSPIIAESEAIRGLPAVIVPQGGPLAETSSLVRPSVVAPSPLTRAIALPGRTPLALPAPRPQLALPPPPLIAPPGHLLAEIGSEAAEISREPLRWFREFLLNPKLVDTWALTLKWRQGVRGARAVAFKSKLNSLIDKGVDTEEAIRQARQELVGELPTAPTGIAPLATPEIRRALFDEVYRVLGSEPLEMLSTTEALSNALAGRAIPRIPGIKGGSAYSRLVRVFGFDMADALAKPGKLESLIEAGDVASRPRPLGPSIRTDFPSTQTFGGAVSPRLLDELPLTLEGQIPLRPEPPPGPFKGVPKDNRPQWLKDIDMQIFREAIGEALPPTGPSIRTEFPPVQALGGVEQQPLLLEPPPGPFQGIPRDPRTKWERELDLEVFRQLIGEVPPTTGPTGPRATGNIPPDTLVKQLSMIPESQSQRMIRWTKYLGLTAMDLGNLVRANVASVDLSYLRQQAFLIPGHLPSFGKSFKDAFRALWSADYARQIDHAMRTDPDFRMYDLLGLDFIRPLDSKVAKAWERAEDFLILGGDRPLQKLADKLPWIRISQRSYVTGMNKMNFDLFKGHVRMLNRINEEVAAGRVVLKPGETFDMQKSIKSYGNMLAEMSGRGPLGPLKELSPVLNAGFFSVRLQIGRLLSPRHLFSSDKFTRQAAWYNFMTAIGAFSGLIIGGREMGLWDVETDIRSSDFMKIKIGRMRIDVWGGFQQYAVLYARLVPVIGGVKSTVTGQVTETDPVEAVSRFAATKRSPGAGQVLTLWTGKDFRGSQVDRRDWEFWLNQNLPIAVQDVTEAFKDQGLIGAGIAAPLSILGQGVNVHDLALQDIALELYGIDYFDLPLGSSQRKRVDSVWQARLTRSEKDKIAEGKKRTKDRAVEREKERRKILQDTLR